MKKIFTLLLSLMLFQTVWGQTDTAYTEYPNMRVIRAHQEYAHVILPLNDSRTAAEAIEQLFAKGDTLALMCINATLNLALRADNREPVSLGEMAEFLKTDACVSTKNIAPLFGNYFNAKEKKGTNLVKLTYNGYAVKMQIYTCQDGTIINIFKPRCGQAAVYEDVNDAKEVAKIYEKKHKTRGQLDKNLSCSYRPGESLAEQNVRLENDLRKTLQALTACGRDCTKDIEFLDSLKRGLNDESLNMPLCGMNQALTDTLRILKINAPVRTTVTVTEVKRQVRVETTFTEFFDLEDSSYVIASANEEILNTDSCGEKKFTFIFPQGKTLNLFSKESNCDSVNIINTVYVYREKVTVKNETSKDICPFKGFQTTLEGTLISYDRSWAPNKLGVGFPFNKIDSVVDVPTAQIRLTHNFGTGKGFGFSLGASAGSYDPIAYTREVTDLNARHNFGIGISFGGLYRSKKLQITARGGLLFVATPNMGSTVCPTIESEGQWRPRPWLLLQEQSLLVFPNVEGPNADLGMFRISGQILFRLGPGKIRHETWLGPVFEAHQAYDKVHPATLKPVKPGLDVGTQLQHTRQICGMQTNYYLRFSFDPIQNLLGGVQRDPQRFTAHGPLEYALRAGIRFNFGWAGPSKPTKF